MKPSLIVAAIALACTFIAPAAQAQKIDVASTFPKDMLFLGDALKQFAKNVNEVTDSKVQFEIHGAGDLVPPLEVLTAVSSGAVPAGYDWVGYWGGSIPVTNLIGALPFGPPPEVLAEWMWEGGGKEIVQKAYDKYNLQFLPCASVPPEPAGWFRKEINSPEDLKGLRMRIGGLAGHALNKAGATTQMIPGGEVFVSLDRGRIDAAEFSLPSIDESIQLQKAAQFYYFPGWHQPSSILSVMINKKTWDGFSKLQQNQIMAACRSTMLWTLTNGVQSQMDAVQRLEAQGTQVRRLPDSVLDVLRKATDDVVQEEAGKDAVFKEAYDSLQAHMQRAKRWQELQQLN
ncbi:TRAP transporter substrate-binding protein [Lampropedia aestuarii]|uniref:TRAP transporter substrate-binding protein n=1 Tax=Lampropedia aestuarii TaxID=2562762 RepID=A0A4V3YXF4_9BURK|nr:TRAP transporter substrate-binding protein [Lampropedia aestuarii]THJ34962.1 TRAP transporter substrate-binding protein [Lampropedia aestuarii]